MMSSTKKESKASINRIDKVLLSCWLDFCYTSYNKLAQASALFPSEIS